VEDSNKPPQGWFNQGKTLFYLVNQQGKLAKATSLNPDFLINKPTLIKFSLEATLM